MLILTRNHNIRLVKTGMIKSNPKGKGGKYVHGIGKGIEAQSRTADPRH
jgi:hypothetical protein